ncbi:MAG: hypothetical protein A2275_10500 [Bacteroidetes bacterium RIFOXYA12_FULL_35_11]|nr:MAG: hypothetical protein A2X01_11680 [Bacteroidetes bacterium GWF2_35_48]OFY79868.1 MAG: hypothetical protein A2275_10500 [Bacteroidetes bacterium RIFOXYA12_FULL_35_11]OFY93058.1 MAG: hypothetical protein A2309_08930 [Bacteroidetes bacterium RIFOXYB2_FULL_35_7]OFZ06562.1 MAG: hypothetical protein A2491_10630 [Bacteroidetes bacterium RIFOXYC12_FULL_35_7]
MIKAYNEYVGNYAILFLLVPTGIYLTIRLKFIQIFKFKHAWQLVAGKFDKKDEQGDVSHFKALTTALSSTVGTGNIVGVALAIYYGGPGAVFWLWVCGFFGMMLKLVECTLALKYRKINEDGTVSGGPMYYMEIGLKEKLGKFAKILALVFAFAAMLCSFGTGNMAQANSMSDVLFTNYAIPTVVTGVVTALITMVIIIGGIKRIGDVTSKLVPFMAIFYFIGSIIVLIVFAKQIPGAFKMILHDAFTGSAAVGGFVGSTFMMTMIWGIRRALFSNEAGQGSAPMAHAAAKTKYPMREGLVASLEPFLDTIVICTLTALVVIVTGAWSSSIKGAAMTVNAFEAGFAEIGIVGYARHFIAIALVLFAFSTIVGWSYYGSRAAQYVFGDKAIKPYYFVYCGFIILGSVWGIDLVWHFVDMVITFMTIPNLIALFLLTPVIVKESREYFAMMKEEKKFNKM